MAEIDHRMERVIFHVDALGGILRKVTIPGHDADHGIADETYLVDRQRRKLDRAQTFDWRRHAVWRRPLRKLMAADDRHDAFGLESVRDIDGSDSRMRVRGTDEMRMQAARHDDIVEITALSGDEAIVLAAQQRLANGAAFGHVGLLSRRRAAAFAIAATMLW